jgi:lon-related putative ATP-dependent protease
MSGDSVFRKQGIIMLILALLAMIIPWWVFKSYTSDYSATVGAIMFVAFFIGGMVFLAMAILFMNLGKKVNSPKTAVPKIIVDNFQNKEAPFYDATGAHAGALLGDVLHDPFQSGGLGTPAHERVVAGMIHKAHMGVLFIDEIATLQPHTQQELLTALQEGKYSITGQSERSAGAMVRTESVPCNFILVAAGNMDTVQHLHPALRSRIRGYGYEVYMKETMPDTKENRMKIAQFVAQEVNMTSAFRTSAATRSSTSCTRRSAARTARGTLPCASGSLAASSAQQATSPSSRTRSSSSQSTSSLRASSHARLSSRSLTSTSSARRSTRSLC